MTDTAHATRSPRRALAPLDGNHAAATPTEGAPLKITSPAAARKAKKTESAPAGERAPVVDAPEASNANGSGGPLPPSPAVFETDALATATAPREAEEAASSPNNVGTDSDGSVDTATMPLPPTAAAEEEEKPVLKQYISAERGSAQQRRRSEGHHAKDRAASGAHGEKDRAIERGPSGGAGALLPKLEGVLLVAAMLGRDAGTLCRLAGFAYPAVQSFRALERGAHGDAQRWLRYWVAYSLLTLLGVDALLAARGPSAGTVRRLVSVAYPALKSFRAVERRGTGDAAQWLAYWLLHSLFAVCDDALRWIPGYDACKCAFLLWAFLPQTRGAELLYNSWRQHPGTCARSRMDAMNSAKLAMEKVAARVRDLKDAVRGTRPPVSRTRGAKAFDDASDPRD